MVRFAGMARAKPSPDGGEAPAWQGSRERRVLCTRATDDAARRCAAVVRWRGPESNWRHHDFQSGAWVQTAGKRGVKRARVPCKSRLWVGMAVSRFTAHVLGRVPVVCPHSERGEGCSPAPRRGASDSGPRPAVARRQWRGWGWPPATLSGCRSGVASSNDRRDRRTEGGSGGAVAGGPIHGRPRVAVRVNGHGAGRPRRVASTDAAVDREGAGAR
jgi:hypothetical protein